MLHCTVYFTVTFQSLNPQGTPGCILQHVSPPPALFSRSINNNACRDNSVGIAIRYGLDGTGIESLWAGEIFRPHPEWHWGPTHPPAQCVPGFCLFVSVVKQPVRVSDHPPHLALKLKKSRVIFSTPPSGLLGLFWDEIYFYIAITILFERVRGWNM